MREPSDEFVLLQPAARWIEKWVDTPAEILPTDLTVLTRMHEDFGHSVAIVKSYHIAEYAAYFSRHWLAARGVFFTNVFDYSSETKLPSRPQVPSNRWHEEMLVPTAHTSATVFIRQLFAVLIRDLFCQSELKYLPFHEREALLKDVSEASRQFLNKLNAILVDAQEIGDACPEPPHITQLRRNVSSSWEDVLRSAQAIEDAICKSFWVLQSHFEGRIHELQIRSPYGHTDVIGKKARANLIHGNSVRKDESKTKKEAAIAELLRRHEIADSTTKTSILKAMAKVNTEDGKAKFGRLRTLQLYCADVAFD